MSLWTPSLDTSPDCCDLEVILSISSIKIIPLSSANLIASLWISASLTNFADSSLINNSKASLTVTVRSTFFFGVKAPRVSFRSIPICSNPLFIIGAGFFWSSTSMVTSRLSSKPFCSCSKTVRRLIRISSVTSSCGSAVFCWLALKRFIICSN